MDVPRKGGLFPQFVWNGEMFHQKEFKIHVHAWKGFNLAYSVHIIFEYINLDQILNRSLENLHISKLLRNPTDI